MPMYENMNTDIPGFTLNLGTHKKNPGSKNCVNRGYLICSWKGRKIGENKKPR